MAKLRPGMRIWIPCEVKPGAFPDERLVRVSHERGKWLGFVNVASLRDPIPVGETFVMAIVEEVEPDRFSARMPGEAVTPGSVLASREKATPFDSLEA
jgi:hypothetical protein